MQIALLGLHTHGRQRCVRRQRGRSAPFATMRSSPVQAAHATMPFHLVLDEGPESVPSDVGRVEETDDIVGDPLPRTSEQYGAPSAQLVVWPKPRESLLKQRPGRTPRVPLHRSLVAPAFRPTRVRRASTIFPLGSKH